VSGRLPAWAVWQGGNEYTLGAEEEEMLLNPHDWTLAQQIDRVLPRLPEEMKDHVTRETHRAASAGTHPSTVWHETVVSSGPRYEAVYGSMRELARREPTFGLHVHVAASRARSATTRTGSAPSTC
jgi:carboxylate-amine ligase